jgi:hypothetical protein
MLGRMPFLRMNSLFKGTMKKKILLASILLASLIPAATGYASTVSWNLPSSYADGTPIDQADVQKIVIRVYAGPTKTGPWKLVATSLPGATSVMVMDPLPGHTLWYTATSTLHGAESEYAGPVSKTNLAIPIIPFSKKVMKKIVTMKKMVFLFSLLLLVGLVWFVRYRRKRGKE